LKQTATGLAGKRCVVMGLGLFGGGAAVARFLARQGAQVLVTDRRDADTLAPALVELEGTRCEYHLGEHRTADFTGAELVIANPAVPPNSPYLEAARAAGVRITSELELFLEHCPASLALISGTQGKSSTANFLAQLLADTGRRAWLGGNIGRSLLDDLDAMGSGDIAVVEVSSYQLDALPAERIQNVTAAALVNVLVDHLERHGSALGYAQAKARLLGLIPAGGTLVLPAELAAREPFASGIGAHLLVAQLGPGQASRIENGQFWLEGRCLAPVEQLRVLGEFQRENALIALSLARALGVSHAHLAARLPLLEGLPHRLQELGEHAGLRVIDNGVCTTPDSALSALQGLPRASAVLLGGKPKVGLSFEALAELCAERGDTVLAFGDAAPSLCKSFGLAGARVSGYHTLEAAVDAAYRHRPDGGVLLFSPACASFDAFPNFRARAEHFRTLLPNS
jgi:UDP-N-acetylmuramoylalanine--D-glutamate ligase